MKHLTLAILSLLFLSNNLYGQNRYAIFLTDKNNSPFSFTIPLDYLSQRAIDRRIKQNIPIDSSDFPVNPSYISQIAAAGATVLTASRWLNAVTIEVPGSSVLNTIYSLPFVKLGYAVNRNANSVYSTKDKFKMENTLHSEQSRKIPEDNKVSSFDYGPSYDQIAMLNGDMLHNSGKTGQGKVIAVIDAGFFNADNMIVFDSLRNQNRLLGTWDFVDQNSMVYDDYAHGTYVLSIMAGNWPGNIVGTAPHAEYWLLRSENAFSETPMEEFTWAAAAEFADSVGADIINSSLGYYEFDNPSQNFIYADLNGNTAPVTIAADFAASKGILVCNSAGNEGSSPWNFIITPADGDSVLTVGAVDNQENYAFFSSKGPTADGRVKPDVAAMGMGTYVADPSNYGVFPGNGTSFSSPVIAGMVACLWQCNPNATNMEVIDALRQSASQFNNPDTLLGYGIPDMTVACLILNSLAVTENERKDELILGANPFSQFLEFSFASSVSQQLQVILSDITGKIVYHNSYTVAEHEISRFVLNPAIMNGVYLLTIKTNRGKFCKKIVCLN